MAIVAPVVLVACSPSATSPGDGGQSEDGDIVGCTSDPRADTYEPGLTKAGQSKLFTFVLVSTDPAPPALDTNTWVLEVKDVSGNPVQGVTLTSVTPFMPDHGHGTSTPQVTPNPDGTITIGSLYLFMAGLWQTTIVAEAGGQRDSVVYSFCVQG
jgi:hypothetical protein